MVFLNNRRNRYILLTLIFFIGLILAVIYCRYHADKFLIDDMLSFSLSNTPGGWVSHEVLGWLDKMEFYRFNVLNNRFDFNNVWLNQANDCHPPLYYSLIHIISSVFSPKLSYWYGYFPNIIFYLLTGLMIYITSYKLSKDYLISLIVYFLYTVNPLVLDFVTFIRMYPLVGLIAICFAYLAIDFFEEKAISKKHYALFIITTAAGCLTHYYSYVIYFFISVIVGLYLLFNKKIKTLIYYCLSVLSGIIIALLIFPAAINHWLNNQHSVNAIKNLNDSLNTFERFNNYLNLTPFGYFTLIITVILLILIIKNPKKLNFKHYSLLFTTLFYFILIGKTSSFVTHRYMVPIDAIFFCGVVLNFLLFYKNNKKWLFIISLFFMLTGKLPTVYIKNYQNPISFAKANYGKLLIVYSDQNWDSNFINVNAFEFREYDNIYLMNDSFEAHNLKADFFLYKDAIVYVGENMDLNKVKNWLFGSSRFIKLEETGIKTSIYTVYYASE